MRHNLWIPDRAKPLGKVLWVMAAVVTVSVLAYSAALRHQSGTLRRTVSAARVEVAALQVQVVRADARVAPFREAAEIAAELGREAADPRILRRLESRVPDDVWFTGVIVSRSAMGIDGRGLALADIARTVLALRATPGIASADVTVVTKSAEGWYAFHLVGQPQGAP